MRRRGNEELNDYEDDGMRDNEPERFKSRGSPGYIHASDADAGPTLAEPVDYGNRIQSDLLIDITQSGATP